MTFTRPGGVGGGYAVSPDGRWLVTGEGVGEKNLRIWDLTDCRQTNSLTLAGRPAALAFSPHNELVAAATWEGLVQFWEIPSFREVRERGFRAAAGDLKTLAFSPDGRRLVTGGLRTAVRVWDVATAQQLITLDAMRDINQVMFSADGNQVAAVNDLGDVLIWRAPSLAESDQKEKTRRLP